MKKLFLRFSDWMGDGFVGPWQFLVGLILCIIVGGILAFGGVYGFRAYYNWSHPLVKFQWGEVVELGQCYRSGKSSARCGVKVLAEDGRIFSSEYSRPTTLGHRLPITEYKDRGDDSGRTYFHFSMDGARR